MPSPVITSASPNDVQFISGLEGFVSKAYRCPAGVITIGFGFTMASSIFARWWRGKYGRALRMGDTMTRSDAQIVLGMLLNGEYGAAVTARCHPAQQNVWGGATSVSFNCGTGSLSWQWAKALAAGNIAEAARLLKTTAVTANGRRLPGLVKRRLMESNLIARGDYGFTKVPVSGSAEGIISAANNIETAKLDSARIKQYQQWLKDLGYLKGNADGVTGPETIDAVKRFQQANGLKVDGIVGNATLSTIIRVKDAKTGNKVNGGALAGGLATNVAESVQQGGTPTLTIAIVAVVAVVAVVGLVWLWRNHGRVTGKRVAVA